jgi:hypothetical protein
MSLSLLLGMGRLFNMGAGPVSGVPAIQAAQAVTTTATANPPAAPPAGTENIPAGQAANPFSVDYLTQAAQPDLGLFSTLFLLLSAILLGGGLYYYFVGKNRWRRVHKLNYRLANTWSVIAMSLGGLGVLFVLFRLLAIEGLNLRFWLYLILLAMIGFAIYAAYYFRTRYPAELAKFSKTQKGRTAAAPARARPQATRPANPATPVRPAGDPGNPRRTSQRGERRREKKR